MKRVGEVAKMRKFGLMPRFTIVHHPIREKFGLTMNQYAFIDSIDQLSHRPDHPWCEAKKQDLADFLDIARSTAYEAIRIGTEKELIEKNDHGFLRTTSVWIEQVRLYDANRSER